eukprot:1160143-Pelagomonas_calceolata.AAC.2
MAFASVSTSMLEGAEDAHNQSDECPSGRFQQCLSTCASDMLRQGRFSQTQHNRFAMKIWAKKPGIGQTHVWEKP